MATILTSEDRKRIEATIAEIEQRTAAELVVVTAGASSSYREVKLTYALLAALGAGAVGHFLRPDWSVAAILWLQLASALATSALCSIPSVLRRLLPRALVQEQVEQRAALAFLEYAVFATRDRTGVLILLSELEHRVAILGDEGIHKKLGPGGWEQHVASIVKAIHEGRTAQGVCDTLQSIGRVLTEELPPRADDVNELSDAVRTAR